jgi:hypothetical protein
MSFNIYAGLRSYLPIQGTENEMRRLGGNFMPQGTAAPVASSAGGSFWEVARTGVGAFLVTLLGNPGAERASPATTSGKIQFLHGTLVIDPAASGLTETNLIVVPMILNGSSFTLQIIESDTGDAIDMSQPGTPTANGSSVHWSLLASNDNTQVLALPALEVRP